MSSLPVLRHFVAMALAAGAVVLPGVAFASCGDIGRPCELGDVDVGGTRPIEPVIIPPCQTCGGYDDGGYDNGGEGEGGGSGDVGSPPQAPPPMCRSNSTVAIKQYSDALASQSAKAILANAQHTGFEFGSIIYRDAGGTMRLSRLVMGLPGSIPAFPAQLLAELSLPGSKVLGVVHNHPGTVFTTDAEKVENQNPSGRDWQVADALVNAGVNPDLLQIYVLGPDDIFREFDYNQKSNFGTKGFGKFVHFVTGSTLSVNLPLPPCEDLP